MRQIAEAWSNWAFGPMVIFQRMMTGMLDWHRESPDAVGRLLSSI